MFESNRRSAQSTTIQNKLHTYVSGAVKSHEKPHAKSCTTTTIVMIAILRIDAAVERIRFDLLQKESN